jgi:hypothetical protein
MTTPARLLALALLLIPACGSPGDDTGSPDGGTGTPGRLDEVTTHPDQPPIAPFDECTVYTARENVTAFNHEFVCSELTHTSYPPVGGNHYPIWAAFQEYEATVPWGFLLHAMEHGAVVVAYRCESAADCTLDDDLRAILDERPDDPLCTGEPTRNRMILVPDPELDEPVVAVAWGRMYLATCLDAESLHAFIDVAYAHGRENFCFAGMDGSATGWCAAP